MRKFRQSIAHSPLGRSNSSHREPALSALGEAGDSDSGDEVGPADSAGGLPRPPTADDEAGAAAEGAAQAGAPAEEEEEFDLEKAIEGVVNTICFWDKTPEISKLAEHDITWVDEERIRNCMGCDTAFEEESVLSFFTGTGKHHCRGCGGVFCDECTAARVAMPDKGLEEEVRACQACFEFQELANDYFELKQMLLTGQRFLKHHQAQLHRGNEHRFVYLSPDEESVCWSKSTDTRSNDALHIPLTEVLNVLAGQQTNVFQRSGNAAHEHLCFSVVAQARSVDLEADTGELRDLWVRGLTAAVATCKRRKQRQLASHEAAQRASVVERRHQDLTSTRQNRERTRAQLSELRQAHS